MLIIIDLVIRNKNMFSTKKTLSWSSILIYTLKTTLQKRFAKPTLLFDLSELQLSPQLLRQLYVTFVRPISEYVQTACSPVLRKHVNIENVQRIATRLIDGYKNVTQSDGLLSFNLPSLEYRRIFNDMLEIYKHTYIYDPSTILNKLVMRTKSNRKHGYQIENMDTKQKTWIPNRKHGYQIEKMDSKSFQILQKMELAA